MHRFPPLAVLCLLGLTFTLRAEPPRPTLTPPVRTIDLNKGESQEVELDGGKKVTVKLLDLRETRDEFRDAVRKAEATVMVGDEKVSLISANYRLPVTVAGVAKLENATDCKSVTRQVCGFESRRRQLHSTESEACCNLTPKVGGINVSSRIRS